jgi:hypothetical protein
VILVCSLGHIPVLAVGVFGGTSGRIGFYLCIVRP